MPPIFLYPNIDFEFEYAAQGPYHPPRLMKKLFERWKYILRALPFARDGIPLEFEDLTELNSPKIEAQLLPWGFTPRLAQKATQYKKTPPWPNLEIIKKINAKTFSHQLEKEFQIALQKSFLSSSFERLKNAIETSSFDWVIKDPWGVSGRERIVGTAGKMTPHAAHWIRRHIKNELLFEPWVTNKKEFSLHFEISNNKQIQYLGSLSLLTNHAGTYRGNKKSSSLQPPQHWLTIAHQIAQKLLNLGYWGPISLDAFLGQLEDNIVQRPLVEINARYTFGRIALELQSFLPQSWNYIWWHPTQKNVSIIQKNFSDLSPIAPNISSPDLYRLPLCLDPHSRSQTFILAAPDDSTLLQIEKKLISLLPSFP